ncbi:hypothetical protein H0H92_003553 [Tricholoma furcatifolium]|nr:hypothetical protein H0H92_003553 [Tricholoma furcatifolium]
MASNISSLLNVGWYFGIPFNDTNWRLQIAEKSQAILGSSLLGLQAGNEPDYLLSHGHRTAPYDVTEYANDIASLIQAIQEDGRIHVKDMLIGPSLASGPWSPDRLWPTGYLDRFQNSLNYQSDNCFARYGIGSPVDPQATFAQLLDHNAALGIVQPYLDTSARAQALGKPFLMFETNTATCGGLPGISDSFGAALWAVDYGLTMAASNFSGALLRVGGQNDYYNWTVGAIYYSVLVVAELFGKSAVAQIIDTSNNGIYNPSYAVYDAGVLSKVVLINFIDDASGANDIVGTIAINDGQVPSQVYVKYLEASSVSVKRNITWAGQTFGDKFEANGKLKGDLNIVIVQCDQETNQCDIPLKAPSLAVVFFNDPSSLQKTPAPTFTISGLANTANTATIDPSVLATSNGISGNTRYPLGSTSRGDANGDGLTWINGAIV